MDQPNLKPEVKEFIHQICARAIIRAIENGTYEEEKTEYEIMKEAT